MSEELDKARREMYLGIEERASKRSGLSWVANEYVNPFTGKSYLYLLVKNRCTFTKHEIFLGLVTADFTELVSPEFLDNCNFNRARQRIARAKANITLNENLQRGFSKERAKFYMQQATEKTT